MNKGCDCTLGPYIRINLSKKIQDSMDCNESLPPKKLVEYTHVDNADERRVVDESGVFLPNFRNPKHLTHAPECNNRRRDCSIEASRCDDGIIGKIGPKIFWR